MEKNDRIEMLREAQEMIEQARGMIREAVRGTGAEAAAQAYTIPHLQEWVESEYQCGSLNDLIARIEEDGAEDDAEEDE